MKTSSHFSSKHSALVLGTVFTLSLVGAGITRAQSPALLIPTNLANAAITIQKIFLSTSGVAGEGNPAVTIALDGANGSITANGSINARGNLNVS